MAYNLIDRSNERMSLRVWEVSFLPPHTPIKQRIILLQPNIYHSDCRYSYVTLFQKAKYMAYVTKNDIECKSCGEIILPNMLSHPSPKGRICAFCYERQRPAYDSGWITMGKRLGILKRTRTVSHNLGTTRVVVCLIGRKSLHDPITGDTFSGEQENMGWNNLTATTIDIWGHNSCRLIRVLIWKM